ncbi:MAG: TetR family transcriptional regulator [Desulfobacterales bacterium]|nr:MAG: TetR family transcriptional regulator [Desulfobacterales bacterium]
MKRKEHILQTATDLFAREGYSHLAMARLAKLTGVAQGTIFYHFQSKEHLFQVILERFRAELTDAFRQPLNECDTGLCMLLGRMDCYFDAAGRMPSQFQLLQRHDAYEIAADNPACLDLLKGIYDIIIGFFESAIIKGQADGSVAAGSAAHMAMLIFTMVDGLMRLNTYGIYDAGALYADLKRAVCRVAAGNEGEKGSAPCP